MKGPEVLNRIQTQLMQAAETEIQEGLVNMMMDSMREPFLISLPPNFDLEQVPAFMQEQFINSIKGQMMVSLKSLINANKENFSMNSLIVKKYFPGQEQAQAQQSVEKFSQCYLEEVEAFYNRIQNLQLEDALFH